MSTWLRWGELVWLTFGSVGVGVVRLRSAKGDKVPGRGKWEHDTASPGGCPRGHAARLWGRRVGRWVDG